MSDEAPEATCGKKCSNEMNELCCKPKARCFKGLAILSGIYTVGCGLMLMIIPPVINSHGYPEGGSVDDNLHSMKISTIILMIVFLAGAVINFATYKFFEKRESRRGSVLSGQLMNDFDYNNAENNDHDFEEDIRNHS